MIQMSSVGLVGLCGSALVVLAAATAVSAADSPNAVIDGGFEGSMSAWSRSFYAAPNGSGQCGVESVRVVPSGGRAGVAQLLPIYLPTDGSKGSCVTALPCPSGTLGFALGLVQLRQSDIQISGGPMLEFAFDYRVRSDLGSLWCRQGCDQVYPVFEARIDGATVESGVTSLVLYHHGSDDSPWQRARVAVTRATLDQETVSVSFRLVAGVNVEIQPEYGFGAKVEIDNVSVTTFDSACTESSWSCPVDAAGTCTYAEMPNFFQRTATVPAPPAASDALAPALCDRPCVACMGDVNSDGIVDGGDLGAVLAAWATTDPGADVNGDGEVDGADLAAVLGNWDCAG